MASRAQVALIAPIGLVAALLLLVRSVIRAGSRGSLPALVQAFGQALLAAINRLPDEVKGPLLSTFYLSLPLSLVGACGGFGWKLYGMAQGRLNYFIEKTCKVSLTFSNADKHYDHVIDYIGTRCAVETGKLLASTKPRSKPSWSEMLAGWLGGKTKAPTLYYQPDLQAFSDFFVWTDEDGVAHKIWIHKHVEKPQFRSDSSKNQRDPECIILTLWWTTDPSPLKNFMTAALSTMLQDDSGSRVDIYVKHMWLPMWTKAISKDRRDRDTIVLDENLADDVVEDMKHFFSKKAADWYHNAGIPYRRGYLLYGPPGCGKTSFAQVLAGELGLDVCLMNLSNQEMNDDDLAELLRAAPPRSMLLLEDVDAIFVERSSQSKRGGGVSFSGLLNALDGAAAQEGCVIMLTTNHKDRLDEALIRPGRCDVHVHIQKASQNQARRMYCRFYAKEAKVRTSEKNGVITTASAHGFKTGDQVVAKVWDAEDPLLVSSYVADENTVYYAHVPDDLPVSQQRQLRLYATAELAESGGADGLIAVTGGKGTRLQALPPSAARFGSRIPEKQISMAKLQGYLMKQKLEAEQHFKALREKDQLPPEIAGFDMNDEEQKFLYNEAVTSFAAEASVMNVHELLDVKYEAEEEQITVYDHLHRVGLQRFAPFFEHFGIRDKKQLTPEIKDRMEQWDPDLKTGPDRDRLVELIDNKDDIQGQYKLADLSVLRDRFLATYQNVQETPPLELSRPPAPPRPALKRACSAPVDSHGHSSFHATRMQLVRKTALNAPEEKLNLLDMAHRFQEKLESNGKTCVSFWQLHTHFSRFADDPHGALDNCEALCKTSKDRAPDERTVTWMTTFTFLSRIGLEDKAFALEDAGFKLWVHFKHLSKDELKDKGEMSAVEADLCHAVLQGSKERADLVRNFQTPRYADLLAFFSQRFPNSSVQEARRFALALTDDAGSTYASCLQVTRYLKDAKSATDAIDNISQGLPLPHVAEAARVKPTPPPPPPECTEWVHVWLKTVGLEHHSGAFIGQCLTTREEVLAAPLEHNMLNSFGINKLGERCKLLKLIADEKKKDADEAEGEKAPEKPKAKSEDEATPAKGGVAGDQAETNGDEEHVKQGKKKGKK